MLIYSTIINIAKIKDKLIWRALGHYPDDDALTRLYFGDLLFSGIVETFMKYNLNTINAKYVVFNANFTMLFSIWCRISSLQRSDNCSRV